MLGSFFQQEIYCREMVPGDSAGVPCPRNPCPNTTTTAGPTIESPNLDEAIVCPCKSKLEGSLQEYHGRNPSAVVFTSVRFFSYTEPSMPHAGFWLCGLAAAQTQVETAFPKWAANLKEHKKK